MIYTELTKKAMNIAYDAHDGQKDRGGMPYIFHPYHLAEQMPDEYSVCVALLHDVVEDTDVTLEDLRGIFPAEIVEAIELLTRKNDVDYLDYIRLLRVNPLARQVKIADLYHNMDGDRVACRDVQEKAIVNFLHARYEKALSILEEENAL